MWYRVCEKSETNGRNIVQDKRKLRKITHQTINRDLKVNDLLI